MSGIDVLMEKTSGPTGRAGELVSVAISAHDCASHLTSCLDSIARQSHARLELIVVDDASQDATCRTLLDWIEANGDRFERLRVMRHRHSMGLSAARNLAFEAVTSDAVFALDGDDHIVPRALSRLYEAMTDSGAAVTYSHLIYLEDVHEIGVATDWSDVSFLRRDAIGGMALVDRRGWALVGGYGPMSDGWEHYDLWCKFVEAGLYGVFVPELLCTRRRPSPSAHPSLSAGGRHLAVRRMLSAHPWLELRV